MTTTLRDLFNRVQTHLLAQNCKSASDDECLYRGPEGTSCAVGCLILDEDYTPPLEGLHSRTDRVKSALERSLGFKLTKDAHTMIKDLQEVHDAHAVTDWPASLAAVATRFNLDASAEAP